jgi:hypothetical protein
MPAVRSSFSYFGSESQVGPIILVVMCYYEAARSSPAGKPSIEQVPGNLCSSLSKWRSKKACETEQPSRKVASNEAISRFVKTS